MQQVSSRAATAAIALALAACGGGGGGGSGTNFIPAPPPPPPPPSPTTPPPLPPGPIGLQSDKPFATVGAWTDGWGTLSTDAGAVRISYSAADNRYSIKLPEYQEGYLVPKGGNGSFNSSGWTNLHSTISDVTLGAGPTTQFVTATLDWPASSPFTYTSFGKWFGPGAMGDHQGVFAYGIPTAAGDMPVTGSASYAGQIRGITSGELSGSNSIGPILDVFGSVFLSFDFGAGTLSGSMEPQIAPQWDAISLGTYTFRDTVYSAGSTTFSGAFNVPGSSGVSSFSGSFTGPRGAELMGKWQAPFIYPNTTQVGRMSGVWIAKKGN